MSVARQRGRQCSLGWHDECSDPFGEQCECECHPWRLSTDPLPGFMPCLDCEDGLEYPTPSFSESHPLPVPCPSCSALGQVPHPDTVDSVAEALADLPFDTLELRNWGEESIARVEWLVARTALVAYARRVLAAGGEG